LQSFPQRNAKRICVLNSRASSISSTKSKTSLWNSINTKLIKKNSVNLCVNFNHKAHKESTRNTKKSVKSVFYKRIVCSRDAWQHDKLRLKTVTATKKTNQLPMKTANHTISCSTRFLLELGRCVCLLLRFGLCPLL
jgi:hypothetical protein